MFTKQAIYSAGRLTFIKALVEVTHTNTETFSHYSVPVSTGHGHGHGKIFAGA